MTKKALKSQKPAVSNNLVLKQIKPITLHQSDLFKAFDRFDYLLAYGSAGTGKTFLSLYLALNLLEASEQYKKVIILRSVVPTRDIGYLPGNMKEKAALYEEPYIQILSELYDRGDAYELLKQKGIVNFATTTALRGITFRDAIIIVDEMQNMTDHEINSLVTRMGDNVKLLMLGDGAQIDLNPRKEETGFYDFINVCNQMNSVATIRFDTSDIVRSQFVKEYIMAREGMTSKPKVGFGDTVPKFITNNGNDYVVKAKITTGPADNTIQVV